MNYLKIIGLTLFLSTGTSLFAQDYLGSSLKVNITKKVLPKLHVALEEDFRLRDNLRKADRFLTTLEVSYIPRDFLKVGGAYSLINYNHETSGWEVRHRYYFFATGSYRFNRFTLSLRERFQSTYRVGVKETDTQANPKLYLRSRLEVDYAILKSPFTPFASIESFNTLNDPKGNRMDKLRYTAGSDYKLNKQNTLQLYYRFVNFKDDDAFFGEHMFGVEYSYKF